MAENKKDNQTGNNRNSTIEIRLTGLIQGVGFRPFVYRIATSLNLAGQVWNSNEGVTIRVTGDEDILNKFVNQLEYDAPPISDIESIEVLQIDHIQLDHFEILNSSNNSHSTTRISPDIAVCDTCLADMKHQFHRINYPFINCTLCGPRFTIISDLPYDRATTTMQPFAMCERCGAEYNDISDRRFHAQPVACNVCGPHYSLHRSDNKVNGGMKGSDSFQNNGVTVSGIDAIIDTLVTLLTDGGIVVLKGMGGFHLVCDARNTGAVERLRETKKRDGKPFAVMMADLESAGTIADISDEEAELLLSVRCPIVLLKSRNNLPEAITNNLDTIGIMLPYMPLHYLLFENLPPGSCLVMTSGNFAGEPICIDNNKALSQFGGIFDAVVTFNRDIYNRVDDSVAMVVNGTSRMLRRSRGWVPSPVKLALNVDGILAVGPDLKNTFAIGKEQYAFVSQHIGDLADYETTLFYEETIDRFCRMFRVEPDLIVHDAHPGYHSTRYAAGLSGKNMSVQHHHAHCAAVMAEYGLDKRVLGVIFDGTGYGDDGTIWGGEFLVCDLGEYTRFAHLAPFALPGGDRAAGEPWRSGLALLWNVYGPACREHDPSHLLGVPEEKIDIVLSALEQGVGTHSTSSMGRLFDGIAALTGICSINSFDAEGPIKLEQSASGNNNDLKDNYYSTIAIKNKKGPFAVDWSGLVRAVVADLQNGIAVSTISCRFHNTLVQLILEIADLVRRQSGISDVVLSGGVFQNKLLLGRAEIHLQKADFTVYSPLRFPANDGGIALGQLAIAAKRRESGCV